MTYYPPPPPRPRPGGIDRAFGIGLAILLLGGFFLGGGWALFRAFDNYKGQSSLRQGDELFSRAAKLYKQGNFQEAARLFSQVRASGTASGESQRKATEGEVFCYRELGHQAQERQDYPLAAQWYQAALSVAPGDAQARAELEAVSRVIGATATPAPTATPGVAAQRTTEFPRPPAPGTSAVSANDFVQANQQAAARAATLLAQGDSAARSGDTRTALKAWAQAAAAGPGSPAGWEAQQRITAYNAAHNPLDFSGR